MWLRRAFGLAPKKSSLGYKMLGAWFWAPRILRLLSSAQRAMYSAVWNIALRGQEAGIGCQGFSVHALWLWKSPYVPSNQQIMEMGSPKGARKVGETFMSTGVNLACDRHVLLLAENCICK